jgi:hypothetical protein
MKEKSNDPLYWHRFQCDPVLCLSVVVVCVCSRRSNLAHYRVRNYDIEPLTIYRLCCCLYRVSRLDRISFQNRRLKMVEVLNNNQWRPSRRKVSKSVRHLNNWETLVIDVALTLLREKWEADLKKAPDSIVPEVFGYLDNLKWDVISSSSIKLSREVI